MPDSMNIRSHLRRLRVVEVVEGAVASGGGSPGPVQGGPLLASLAAGCSRSSGVNLSNWRITVRSNSEGVSPPIQVQCPPASATGC